MHCKIRITIPLKIGGTLPFVPLTLPIKLNTSPTLLLTHSLAFHPQEPTDQRVKFEGRCEPLCV